MQLLIDTDALTMLLALDLLEEAPEVLAVSSDNVAILPAAPPMLRRAKSRLLRRWPELDGSAAADRAQTLRVIDEAADASMVARLNEVDGIDPGEVILFGTLACNDSILLTGDERAIRALYRNEAVRDIADACQGRFVCVPRILTLLAGALGLERVQSAYLGARTDHPTLRMLLGSRGDCSPASFEEAVHSLEKDLRVMGALVSYGFPGDGP